MGGQYSGRRDFAQPITDEFLAEKDRTRCIEKTIAPTPNFMLLTGAPLN
jgi:hypothetical protein